MQVCMRTLAYGLQSRYLAWLRLGMGPTRVFSLLRSPSNKAPHSAGDEHQNHNLRIPPSKVTMVRAVCHLLTLVLSVASVMSADVYYGNPPEGKLSTYFPRFQTPGCSYGEDPSVEDLKASPDMVPLMLQVRLGQGRPSAMTRL